ncbi:recombination regulator RecX [Clostridium aestuarii]|uniref:Regulatory protein RecX n=1 Tax=Clostridium aestuarii TaxID=338193 RepID=A0ABT4CVJ3_9CLOT|nr:recombination regulator RecX [Clostridium aestuarii]
MKRTITKIEIGKKNKDRVNVFLDGEFTFACSSDLVYYYKLKKDEKIDLEILKEVIYEDNYLKAKNTALKILEKSYKTEKEISDKLIKKEFEEKVVARVMVFLKEYNFVDDCKYADMFIREKISSSGKSKMKFMLLKKGISKELIDEKFKNIDCSLEKDAAFKLAQKKYNIIKKSENNYMKTYKKIGNYLASRGFDYNIINNVLTEVVNEEHDSKECSKKNYEQIEEEHNIHLEELYNLAKKRYNIICKSEKDNIKIYRKLSQYLLRRGYKWENVKKILKEIVQES